MLISGSGGRMNMYYGDVLGNYDVIFLENVIRNNESKKLNEY